mmetsp:Transcript_122710/g.244102  ORF Transcript_122710/g.244102 Transcript_122710/m.244102 type:complete len:316 (+) Transcript_122710:1356-2303(+)
MPAEAFVLLEKSHFEVLPEPVGRPMSSDPAPDDADAIPCAPFPIFCCRLALIVQCRISVQGPRFVAAAACANCPIRCPALAAAAYSALTAEERPIEESRSSSTAANELQDRHQDQHSCQKEPGEPKLVGQRSTSTAENQAQDMVALVHKDIDHPAHSCLGSMRMRKKLAAFAEELPGFDVDSPLYTIGQQGRPEHIPKRCSGAHFNSAHPQIRFEEVEAPVLRNFLCSNGCLPHHFSSCDWTASCAFAPLCDRAAQLQVGPRDWHGPMHGSVQRHEGGHMELLRHLNHSRLRDGSPNCCTAEICQVELLLIPGGV